MVKYETTWNRYGMICFGVLHPHPLRSVQLVSQPSSNLTRHPTTLHHITWQRMWRGTSRTNMYSSIYVYVGATKFIQMQGFPDVVPYLINRDILWRGDSSGVSWRRVSFKEGG